MPHPNILHPKQRFNMLIVDVSRVPSTVNIVGRKRLLERLFEALKRLFEALSRDASSVST